MDENDKFSFDVSNLQHRTVLLRDVHSFAAANEVSKRHAIEIREDFSVLYRFERS